MSVMTIVISTWQVPFAQTADHIEIFEYVDEESWERAKMLALRIINARAKKWWEENKGAEYIEKGKDKPEDFKPITELGYEWGKWELWGGETGFDALIDKTSWWKLHHEYYKREFDDKGLSRPGYLRSAYGEDVMPNLAEVFEAYGVTRH